MSGCVANSSTPGLIFKGGLNMPNHVTNVLTLKGHKDAILGCLSAIKRDHKDGEEKSNYEGMGTIDFEKIIPMPKNIYRGSLGPEEREKYGKDNWYDWSVAHWGTKWNAYNAYGHEILPVDDIDENDDYVMTFETAWCAPHPAIKTLSEMYPEIEFEHLYFDEFLEFAGIIRVKGGILKRVYEPSTPKAIFEFMCNEYWHNTPEEEGAVLNMDGTVYVHLSNSYVECTIEYEGKRINGLTAQDWHIRKSWIPDKMAYYVVRLDPKRENIPVGIDTLEFDYGYESNTMSFMVMKGVLDDMIDQMNQHPEKITLTTINDKGQSQNYTTLGEFIEANK